MAVEGIARTGCGGAMRVLVPPHYTAGEPPPAAEPPSSEPPSAGRPPAEPPLRGRDAEVAVLAASISRLRDGRGGVLVIEGPPGAGASRLTREARAIAAASSICVLRGIGGLRKLSAQAEQRFRLLRSVQDRLRRAALDRPLLIVVDDLQWRDAGTLLALRTLPARLAAQPILWLVTVRGGSPGADAGATVARLADGGARTVRLGPLPDAAVAAIARDLLGAEPGGDVLDLLRQAGGRPLLVIGAVRGMLADGAVAWTDGVAHLAGRPAPIHSYGSPRRLLGHLSPLALEVLQIASVLGGDLEAGRLADLSGRTIAELVAPLQEAVDAGLVRPTDPLAFRHDGVREAVRRTVPADVRRALRRRAADLSLAQGAPLGQVALAMAETAEPGDRETAALLRRALHRAAPDTAATIARRAVALAPAGSAERAAAVADALPLLTRAGRGREGLELAETALVDPLTAPVEARIRQGAAVSAMMRGSFTGMLRHSRAGAALAGVPEGAHAHLTALRCLATLLTGDVPAAERLLAPAAEAATRAGNDAALALLHTADSIIRALRLDFTEAQRLAAEAVEAAGRAPDASALSFPAVWRASLYAMMGDAEEALREASKGVTAARRPGHAHGLNLWPAARAHILLAAGRPAEARAEAEAALTTAGGSGAGGAVSRAARSVIRHVDALTDGAAGGLPPRFLDPADDPSLVRTALEAGRRREAAATVAKAERRADLNPGVPFFAAVAAHTRGLLDENVEAVERAVVILREIDRPLSLAAALEDAGRLLMESDREAAAEHLAKAEAAYAEAGAGNAVARVRRLLGSAGRRRVKRRRAAQGWDALTPAEQRVASLVAEGASNRQAAEQLFLSPATVGTHLMHAFRKLGVNSRVELARAYLERGAG